MKNIPFGYRFYVVALVSFFISDTWLDLSLPDNEMDYEGILPKKATAFSYALIGLIYYIFLGKILKTRLRKLLYFLYLFIGGIIAISFLKKGYGVMSVFSYATPLSVLTWESIIHILTPVCIATLLPFIFYGIEWLQEVPWFRQFKREGVGGSSRWATVRSYHSRPAKLRQDLTSFPSMEDEGVTTSRIFLGRSLFSDDPFSRLVGIDDDSNMITVGTIGSGKSISVIYPNLSMYLGSALVIDPKGEHSRMTYRRRSSKKWLEDNDIIGKTNKQFKRGRCYMLDPFGINKDHGLPSHCYNPLSEINLISPNCREVISAVADGCVSRESPQNQHFEEMARSVLQGLIAYVLDKYEPHNHTLPFILDLMYGIKDGIADSSNWNELMWDMMTCQAAGGLAQQAASELEKMGERERGAVLSTLARSLKWVGDPAMRRQLSRSDFKFSEIGIKEVQDENGQTRIVTETLYFVLPDTRMKPQMRWLRTLTSVGIALMQNRPQKPPISTLFILDEYPRLGGQITAISEGYGTLREHKVKLWIFLQNLGQLKHDEPKRWSSMCGNSNTQVFGVGMGDPDTARWVSETLGKSLRVRTERRGGILGLMRRKVVNETPRELLTASEVTMKLGQKSNLQVVFPAMGFPMRLERLSFKPLKIGGKWFKSIGLDGLRGHFENW